MGRHGRYLGAQNKKIFNSQSFVRFTHMTATESKRFMILAYTKQEMHDDVFVVGQRIDLA